MTAVETHETRALARQESRALPTQPFEPVAPDSSAQVPLLIGTNKDEMTLFFYPNDAIDAIDATAATAALAAFHRDQAAELYAAYCSTRPTATPGERLTQAMTDRFRIGSIRLAERKAAQGTAPVWMYRFDFETDVLDGRLGAPHAMEVAYVFGIPDAVRLSGQRPERHKLASQISGAWAAFAHNGNPQTAHLPDWPPYEPQHRSTMIFNTTSGVLEDPDGKERNAWEGFTAGI